MKYAIIFSILLLTCSIGYAAETQPAAHADLKDATGQKVGTAQFYPNADGVGIKVEVNGLPAGEHALHIHNVGSCVAPDFKSAGPHFNPSGKAHGLDSPAGHHAGDMKNITLNADGKGTFEIENKDISLGAGPNSLFHDGGTAVVIHKSADDYKTDPAGNAGDRIACGEIVKN